MVPETEQPSLSIIAVQIKDFCTSWLKLEKERGLPENTDIMQPKRRSASALPHILLQKIRQNRERASTSAVIEERSTSFIFHIIYYLNGKGAELNRIFLAVSISAVIMISLLVPALIVHLSHASSTVTVTANPLWTDTGLNVEIGVNIGITASGSWSWGTEGGPSTWVGPEVNMTLRLFMIFSTREQIMAN